MAMGGAIGALRCPCMGHWPGGGLNHPSPSMAVPAHLIVPATPNHPASHRGNAIESICGVNSWEIVPGIDPPPSPSSRGASRAKDCL